MIRNGLLAPGEYYHICNRGVNKQTIFHDTRDYIRFLFLIIYFQSPEIFQNITRYIDLFVKHRMFNINVEKIIKKRTVELVAFCIMPNHFHLILKEVEEGGISSYMQRVLNAYGKYYNTKYERSGHVFQGPYRLVHIEDDRQMRHTSAYIHRNPREIKNWFKKEHLYPWSSYQDFIGKNRWGKLLVPDIAMGESSQKQYEEFVRTSPAKVLEEEFEYLKDF